MTTTPALPEAATGNLADIVRAAAVASPDRPALIAGEERCTWSELDAAVDAGAAALIRSGLAVGDRVVLALPTGRELAAALFATLRAGLIAVPVRPDQPDLAWVVERTGAGAVVQDGWDRPGTHAISSDQVRAWWATGGSDAAVVPGGPGAPDEPAGSRRAVGEDIALLARASRSGPPVMLSHRALISAATAVYSAPRVAMRAEDRVLQVLPLFHVVGLVTAFLPAALAGSAVVIPGHSGGALPAEGALAAVQQHRVSVLPAEPTLYRQLDRIPDFGRALATVRLMTSGSSPLDPADLVAIRSVTGAGVREGYGISEAAAAVTSTLMCDAARPGSVGRPYLGVEVHIVGADDDSGADGGVVPDVDPDRETDSAPADSRGAHESDDGADSSDDDGSDEGFVIGDSDDIVMSAGEVGPIAIRGDTLFSGYWPDGSGGPDEDGWFVTGDIGYLDDAGELHMVDRAAETIVVAGFTVYPREVEDVLAAHSYVADAAVVGIPGRGGPAVVAAVVPQPGTRPTADDLDDFVADKLAPFKRPTDYLTLEGLPRTEVGRLDRDAVRRLFAEARGIDLEGPATLRATAGGRETAPTLGSLGAKLPADATRTQRSAQDTDDDLF